MGTWSLTGLVAPWGERPSILAALRPHLDAGGALPFGGVALPDEEPRGEGGIRFAPGARDGMAELHGLGASTDVEPRARALADAVAALLGEATDDHLAALHRAATAGPLLDALTPALKRLEPQVRALPATRVVELAEYLVTQAPDREVVKLGLTLAGRAGPHPPALAEAVKVLAAHDELTRFALDALEVGGSNWPPAVWHAAFRVHGWGRIHAVHRLARTAGVQDPAIRGWLLREGFRNYVMHEYLAGLCARVGRLHAALLAEAPDAALLAGAAEILRALVDGREGPADSIDDYDQAAPAMAAYLEHVAALPAEGLVEVHLAAARTLLAFLESDEGWDERIPDRWSDEERATCRALAARVVATVR